MFVIETEIGRFEAETEREAKKALRKAQREHKAREKVRQANRDRAYERAYVNGYRFLKRKAEGNAWPVQLCEAGKPCGPKVKVIGENHFHAVYETENGAIEARHYGYRPVASLITQGGWTIGVMLENLGDGDRYELIAVGACEGECAFAALPGIAPEDFAR